MRKNCGCEKGVKGDKGDSVSMHSFEKPPEFEF